MPLIVSTAPVTSSGGGALTLATTTVDLELATKQNLLSAVPASTIRVIVRLVVRNASVDLSTIAGDLLFGFDAGASNLGVSIDAADLAALTDNTKFKQNPILIGATGTVGAATDVFGCILDGTQFPSPATVDVDVLYYDVAI